MPPELGAQLKLERRQWDILQDAFIGGDSYAYFYQNGEELDMEIIDNTCIMFADEQNPDIQGAAVFAGDSAAVCGRCEKEAQENGVKKEDIKRICADDDTGFADQRRGGEVNKRPKKLTSIMKLWKQDRVCAWRSTKTVVYQPEPGLRA